MGREGLNEVIAQTLVSIEMLRFGIDMFSSYQFSVEMFLSSYVFQYFCIEYYRLSHQKVSELTEL